MENSFATPILFLVFNRPEKTLQVFERIKSIKPSSLFVAADGPRLHLIGESELCDEVRNIVGIIDWDCDVKYLFREENLGCSKAVVSAIDWFFDYVENGIILEDDCLPDVSFFRYCEELLSKYKDNNEVMLISGTNLGNSFGNDSYYFSKYGQIWGWATWKSAWFKYERNIYYNGSDLKYNSIKEKKFWQKNFRDVVWDVQWAIYSVWKNNGIAILPNTNLVTNIGFGIGATNYIDDNSVNSKIELSAIDFPLNHPNGIVINASIDKTLFTNHYYIPLKLRLVNKLKKIYPLNILTGKK